MQIAETFVKMRLYMKETMQDESFGINYDLMNEANDGEFSTWSVVVRWSMVEVDN